MNPRQVFPDFLAVPLMATAPDSMKLIRGALQKWKTSTSLVIIMLAFLVAITFPAPALANRPGVDGPFTPVTEATDFCEGIVGPYLLYNCTEHMVTTLDGFRLSVQRIVAKAYPESALRDEVLFLLPPILGGNSWFIADHPIPLTIADAGYSAWIANSRATEYTFGHTSLSPSQQEFWNWDMDEVTNYDFPALVDFVLSSNNGRKVHFVGFSQGARAGLGSVSYQMQRTQNLASVTLLAPLVYLTNTRSRVLLGLNYTDVAELAYHIGLGKLSLGALSGRLPEGYEGLEGMENEILCQITGRKLKINCTLHAGPNCCIDTQLAYDALTEPHAVMTYKNLAHLTQGMRSHIFAAFDYGIVSANKKVYDTEEPPWYRLDEIPVSLPIFVLYGGLDTLSTPTDIETMIKDLPQPPQVLKIPGYAHLDFILSSSLLLDINVPVLNFIGLHNSTW